MDHRLGKIKIISLREQVITAIRDAIIEGKFKPGEKIPEQELAQQLGVSRTPIREAIRILEQQGLVVTVPKSGTYVTESNIEKIKEAIVVRVVIEQLALREAIEHLDDGEWGKFMNALEDILHRMQIASEDGDGVALTELDIDWHSQIVDAAHNQYLSWLWRSSGLQYLIWSPERSLYPLAKDKWWEVIYGRHKKLLDSLKSRNIEKCCAAIQEHIEQKYQDLDGYLH